MIKACVWPIITSSNSSREATWKVVVPEEEGRTTGYQLKLNLAAVACMDEVISNLFYLLQFVQKFLGSIRDICDKRDLLC